MVEPTIGDRTLAHAIWTSWLKAGHIVQMTVDLATLETKAYGSSGAAPDMIRRIAEALAMVRAEAFKAGQREPAATNEVKEAEDGK